MPDAPRLRITREGAVVVLLIENPPRNLLSLSMVAELAARVADLEKDDSVRAAVLTGAGHANFCAGLDMDEWSRLSPKAFPPRLQSIDSTPKASHNSTPE